MSAVAVKPIRRMDDPIRMTAVEVTVFVDHLQLHPQTEFEAEILYLAGESADTGRDLLQVAVPVAQAPVVVISDAEPAVVENEQLNAALFGLGRDLDQLVFIKVEVSSFPVVEKDGTGQISVFAAHKAGPVESVEGAAHSAESLAAVDHYRLRRLEALALLQLPAEVLGINAHHDPGQIEGRYFCLREEIAAVKKAEAVYFALFLCRSGSHERKERILFRAAGCADKALDRLDAHLQFALLHIPLSGPCACEGDHSEVHIRPLHGHTHGALDHDRRIAVMDEAGVSCDHGIIAEDREGKNEICIDHVIVKRHQKRLRFIAALRISGRQRKKGRFSIHDLAGDICEIRHSASVFLQDRSGGAAIVAGAVDRVFLFGILHGKKSGFRHAYRHQRAHGLFVIDIIGLLVADLPSIVQVLQLVIFHDSEDVADTVIIEMKCTRLFVEYNRHTNLPFIAVDLCSFS